ncbi:MULTISPECIES: signal peptidase I [Brevibacillus]|uniref:signal peptidase I n=1 Tax=Brevibacillus TaxID=55080 RepID=UPI0016065A21|nr:MULTISPECIES: signal peptidase I [Brevibacillus]MDH4617826.1 signal peptidase I [Brevibacillus sp. AY1]
MRFRWVKQAGLVFLALFTFTNLFLYTTSRWNPDQIPGYGDWRVLSVLTGSMSPAIAAGDMVIVVRYGQDQPRVGDIVTYYQNDKTRSLMTHRVMQRLENGYLQTKGDANKETDGGWTDPSRLLGKVVFTIPYAASFQQMLREPLTLGFLLAGFAAFLIYTQRKKNSKQDLTQTECIEGEVS